MRLDGTLDLAAPADRAWTLLSDPVSLAACVPGVRDVRQVDASTFEGSITASVGPMDGDFAFTAVITRAERPHLDVAVGGVDSRTRSRLEGTVTARLDESAPGQATLAYQADIRVKGRLAILGEMVLRATASLMIIQVTANVRTRLEAAANEPGVAG